MNKKTFLIFFSSFLFLIGWAPKESSISGDVFLTMANGSVKPIAGAEVYLFPLESDFDSSFVEPLKFYINEAKFNISRELIIEECSIQRDNLENIYTANVELWDSFLEDGLVSPGLSCNNLQSDLSESELSLENENIDLENQTSSLQKKISQLEAAHVEELEDLGNDLEELKADLYKIAMSEGNILKNEQMKKVKYDAAYRPYEYFLGTKPNDPLDQYDNQLEVEVKITNYSDYIILGVSFSDLAFENEPIPSELEDLFGAEVSNFSFREDSGSSRPVGIQPKKNEYNESIPGIGINDSRTGSLAGLYYIKSYKELPTNRWLDENIQRLKIIDYPYKESYCYRDCVDSVKVIDLGFPDISDITFGEPYKRNTDPSTKKVTYTSKEVDWVVLGKQSDNYINNPLRDKIELAEAEIENFKRNHVSSIAIIEDEISKIIASSRRSLFEGELEIAETKLDSCISATDYRDVSVEAENCLANTDSSSSLTSMINESTSTFGKKLRGIFNSVEVSDLGYSNFEQLLNSYGKNRNAYKAVTGIQGNYEFLNVPNGNYVIFTYYEDRFNGVGYWLEELDIEEDFKADLNNINFKKEGVYSYLRDKLEN